MKNILLLHGALGSALQFSSLKERLEKEHFSVLELNFSGHAGVPFEVDFGVQQFAKETIQFINRHSIQSCSIFGYSMGGYVAILTALIQPDLIKSILTLGTKFDWSPDSAEREIKKMNPEKIEEKVPAFARLLDQRHKPNNWKELIHRTAGMMYQLGQQPLLNEQNFKSVRTKVSIALGDQDDMADLAYSKLVSSWINNSQFFHLKNTPHPFEKVNQDQLMQLILNEL